MDTKHFWETALEIEVAPPAAPLFETGPFYASAGALALDRDGIADLAALAARHAAGDWGDLPESEARENAECAGRGWRVVSEYRVNRAGDRVLAVTEADRSGTTLLTAREFYKGQRNGRTK